MANKLLLDLEGVAFDPLPCTVHAVRRALIRIGHPSSPGYDLARVARQPIQHTLDELLPADEALRQTFLQAVRDYYCRQRWHAARREPGLAAMLAGLGDRHGVERVVVSGNPRPTVERQLADLALTDHVDRVSSPDHGGCANCRRRLAGKEVSDNPTKPVWLTDLPGELIAAREMGLTAVGALWGRMSEGGLRQYAEHLAESPGALLASWPHLVETGSGRTARAAEPESHR